MTNTKKSFFTLLAFSLMAGAWTIPAFSQTAPTSREQINKLQTLITQKGAKWVAGETSVSGLSEAEAQNLLGLTITELKAPPIVETRGERVPASVDWRDASGNNYVSGVRNQKKCGDCWAFALTGALESYVMRTRHTPGSDLDLSEQVMLSCSGVGTCNGGTLNADFLENTGLPPEAAYPYTALDGTCSTAAQGWQDQAYKIDGWGSVSHSVSSIKSAVAKYGPMPIALMVYEDFMKYKSGIYSYTTGKKLGGHAVLLVGYNDAEQYFIVKNSWGPAWGENGFFRIAYSEATSVVSFGLNAVAYKSSSNKEMQMDAAGQGSPEDWGKMAPMFEPLMQWAK